MIRHLTLAAAATAILLAGGGAFADDPIQARKDGFKAAKAAMGEIKMTLDKGEVAAAGAPAQKLGAIGAHIPALFPAGSDKGDTKAKAALWSDFADFTAKAQAFEAAAKKLEEVAATGDKAATMKQFGAVGGTCKACHDSYRAE